jgi:hypothetical protein
MDLDTSVGKLTCVLGEGGEPSFVTQHSRDLQDDAIIDNSRNRVVSEPQKIPFFLQDGFDEFGSRRPSKGFKCAHCGQYGSNQNDFCPETMEMCTEFAPGTDTDDDDDEVPPTGEQETATKLTEEETTAATHARSAIAWLDEELTPTIPGKTCELCNKPIKDKAFCTECAKKADQTIDQHKVITDLNELRKMALNSHKPSAEALQFHLLSRYGMFPTGTKVQLNTETFNGVEGHVADVDLSKIGPGRVPVKIVDGPIHGVKLVMFDKLFLL